MDDKYNKLIHLFEMAQRPENAEAMSAYLRGQFPFYGLKTVERRKLYKPFIAADRKAKTIDWGFLTRVWDSPYREMQYFVCDYLSAFQKDLRFEDVPKIEAFARSKQWWDTIDCFDQLIGRIAFVDTRINQLMLDWSTDDNFWIRRLAIDHQLGRKDKTDTELLARIILNNLGSKEFFINKAIGWSLRDYSKINPDWVRQFIQEHRKELEPLSIREGSKYL